MTRLSYIICILILGFGIMVEATSFPVENIKLIAHRGESSVAPENTMASFRTAWKGNIAYAIELDVHVTKDNQIVCSHDATLKRVTQGACKSAIKDMTVEEIKKYDVGSFKDPQFKDERVPLLSEVLDELPQNGRIFLEIKTTNPLFPSLLKELLAKYPHIKQEQIIVISFQGIALLQLRREYPGFKQFLLAMIEPSKDPKVVEEERQAGEYSYITPEEAIEAIKQYECDGLDAGRLYSLTPEYVDAIHKAGYEFHTWTIDKPEYVALLFKAGVDSVTTNKPTEIYEEVINLLK